MALEVLQGYGVSGAILSPGFGGVTQRCIKTEIHGDRIQK